MEEYSTINSMSQAPTDQYTPEESSWTTYLEDFWLQNNSDDQQSSAYLISSSCESTLISDAGSSVANKKLTDNTHEENFNVRLNNIMNNRRCSRLSFKKRKTKEANLVLDDSLEDTASSPVNSPKVFNLSQLGHVKSEEKSDQRNNISEEIKGSTSGQIDHGRSISDQQVGFIGSESDRCTELKKRGLCLVPLSMLVNYLG